METIRKYDQRTKSILGLSEMNGLRVDVILILFAQLQIFHMMLMVYIKSALINEPDI